MNSLSPKTQELIANIRRHKEGIELSKRSQAIQYAKDNNPEDRNAFLKYEYAEMQVDYVLDMLTKGLIDIHHETNTRISQAIKDSQKRKKHNMKKSIFFILVIVLFSSCADTPEHIQASRDRYNKDRKSKEVTSRAILPEELKDCRIYEIESIVDSSGYSSPTLYITRCPEAITSTTTNTKHKVITTSN